MSKIASLDTELLSKKGPFLALGYTENKRILDTTKQHLKCRATVNNS